MNITYFKIGQRLTIGFGIVLALLAGILSLSIFSLTEADDAREKMAEIEKSAAISKEFAALVSLNFERIKALAEMGNNPGATGYYEPLVEETSVAILATQKALQERPTTEQGTALMAAIAEPQKVYIEARAEFFKRNQMFDPSAMDVVTSQVVPAAQQYLAAMGALLDYQNARVAEMKASLQAQSQLYKMVMIALGVVALILGVWLSWAIARSISRPIREAVTAALQVAKGDLTHPVPVGGKDEMGELLTALNAMQQSLVRTVSEVRHVSDHINVTSSEVASGNQDLSARTELTASNLEETAASMEQITSTLSQSADAARQANQLAASASEIAVRGGQVVGEVVTTMDAINHSSKKISDIIGVIDGIAFPTNILALNAAVEAARAGEQGRGFAVVAGEVRNLAQRSAEAAKEIKGLIGTSVDKVEAGSRLVAEAGQTMSEIVGSVQRVSDIIGEITAAAGEQSDGIGQVNVAVSQLDQMTQQNAALVEESAAAAGSLRDQASRLAHAVQVFRMT